MNGLRDERGGCSVCGGRVSSKRIVYIQEKQGDVYLVSGVPADVCVQCGEEYLEPDTVDAIQLLLEGHEPADTREVPVYAFPGQDLAEA